MTKEALAEKLNGREYGNEITEAEAKQAKADGLLVIFGYSDDNAELRGVIDDEVGCYDGGAFLLHSGGVVTGRHVCDCEYCGFKAKESQCVKVEALFGREKPYTWTYRTSVPHATFNIMEDGKKFCRGIVIAANYLPKI